MRRSLNDKIGKMFILRHRNSCRCKDTLIVVICRGLVKVEGFVFELWVRVGPVVVCQGPLMIRSKTDILKLVRPMGSYTP